MQQLLEWMVFQAGVCYARKRWVTGKVNPKDDGELAHYERTWEQLWRVQRDLGAPPIGLIRSC